MMQKLSAPKVLLFVVGSFVAVVTIMLLTTNSSEQVETTIFGEVKVKTSKDRSENDRLSNYDTIKQEKNKPAGNNLRYKVKVKKENPFLSLYQEEKKPIVAQKVQQKQAPSKNTAMRQADTGGFFSLHNTELDQEKKFFKAIFRETQQVQPGKALRIILQEAIPELNLEAGTILKGVPNFAGERIEIRITAGVVGKEIRRLDLLCFDKEDLIEGIFHDQLAKQLEEATKEGLIDEVLDLDFKGNGLARKANNLTKFYKNITIDKGREVFVAMFPKEAE